MLLQKLIAIFGMLLIMFIVWLMSENKRQFPWRIVLWGVALQFIIGTIVLNFPAGVSFFKWFGDQVAIFLG